MPEGPSIVILKKQCEPFRKQVVKKVSGNTKIAKEIALNQKVLDFKSWGKHFLICFNGFTFRIHFLLFGSYRLNEDRDAKPRLRLDFDNGWINFYACSVRILEENPDDVYDWSADVMSRRWDAKAALKKITNRADLLACDALLDQSVFAGVGNIIKNEVLFRTKIHPLSITKKIPLKKRKELVDQARRYSFDFLRWKKKYVLRKHWLVHTKKKCPDCQGKIVKEYLGKSMRRTFFCKNCQKMYN